MSLTPELRKLWKQPRIGVCVVVTNRYFKVLLGLRKGSHGAGNWGFPGGHLESGETIFDCAARELKEETGMILNYPRIPHQRPYTNDIFKVDPEKGQNDLLHYVTLYVLSQINDQQPKLLERDKCEEWRWFHWTELPDNLFLPVRNWVANDYNGFVSEGVE